MLLADLHIHTTWSDGRLSIPEVIDLFGRSGHDVIAITDHIVNNDNLVGKITHRFGLTLTKDNFDAYRAEVDAEAARAWDEFGMLVIAGAELTQNRIRRATSAHVLALDIDTFISAEGSVEEMLVRANDPVPSSSRAIRTNSRSGSPTPSTYGIAAMKSRRPYTFGSSPAGGTCFRRWHAIECRSLATATFTTARTCTRGKPCCRASATSRTSSARSSAAADSR